MQVRNKKQQLLEGCEVFFHSAGKMMQVKQKRPMILCCRVVIMISELNQSKWRFHSQGEGRLSQNKSLDAILDELGDIPPSF